MSMSSCFSDAQITIVLDDLQISTLGLSWEREGSEHLLHFSAQTSPDQNQRLIRKLLELKEIDDIKASEIPSS